MFRLNLYGLRGGLQSVSGWQSWCSSGSATNAFINSWEWMKHLEGCIFNEKEGVYYDQQPREGWVLENETILSDSTKEVFYSTYQWAIGGHYIPGTGSCRGGIYSSSSFTWVADVNKGYTEVIEFERVYVPR